MKFCKDCKHWSPPSNHHNDPDGDCYARRTVTVRIDVVHGKQTYVGLTRDPVNCRSDKDQCGPDAAWFEQRVGEPMRYWEHEKASEARA